MKKVLAGGCAALLCSASAHAGWSVNGDVEHLRWAESTDPRVSETGPMFGIGGGYRGLRPEGWQFGWRGRVYGGAGGLNAAVQSADRPASAATVGAGTPNGAR